MRTLNFGVRDGRIRKAQFAAEKHSAHHVCTTRIKSICWRLGVSSTVVQQRLVCAASVGTANAACSTFDQAQLVRRVRPEHGGLSEERINASAALFYSTKQMYAGNQMVRGRCCSSC